LLIGDFNLRPDEVELQPLLASFRDAWASGVQNGAANGSGATHSSSRIDFIFHRGNGVGIASIEAIETGSWFGASASDHRPLVATVQVPRVLK
jgi:endonuclease/exonuclease/phosphatase family metal-dependent hydrolase